MPREINQTQSFSNKLVKFIPTEIVGGYMTLAGFLGFGPEVAEHSPNDTLLIQVVFFFLLVLTPVYLWFISEVRNGVQLAVSTISYMVWAYSLGGPFVIWEWYDLTTASVVMVLWTFIPPLLVSADPPISAEKPAPS